MEGSKEISMDQLFIKKLNNTVFENLQNEQFGVEGLASQIGLSRSQIHRKLKEINGKSVTQFIREIRLKEAHRLLENNVGTASEIAYQVGFGSPTYFNKCFHEYYGYTPGEVKERQNPNGRKRGIISTKHLWTSLKLVLLLVMIFFSYLFLSGNFTKTSNPQYYQNKSHDALEPKSIAVLPFEFLGEDNAYNYYSDGMVSEILNHLHKIGDLDVKSDILSRQFANTHLTGREIGEAFGANYILRGSILVAGNAIRIDPKLIEARTNKILWSVSFGAELSDISEILALQSDVAMKVAHACKAAISPEAEELIQGNPVPDNDLTYQYYLKGQEYWNSKGDHVLATDMYSKAIEADPSFAPAYARRAIMHAYAYYQKSSENWLDHDRLASADIKKAMQLDPTSLEAKFAQCIYNYYIDREYERAISILDDLKKKMPTMAELYAYTAWIKRRQGKWQESIIENEKAVQLEPFNVVYIRNLSGIYERLRNFDKSIEIAKEGLEKVPDYDGFQKRIFGATRKKTGNLKIALATAELEEKDVQRQYFLYYRQFDELINYIKNENFSFAGPNNFHPKNHNLALYYHYNGDTIMSKIYAYSAIQLLEKMLLENPLDHRLQAPLSKCYALLGDHEKAIEYGKQAIKALPVEVDAIRGIGRETEMAKTYVLIGDYDRAMDQIEYLLSVPGFLTVGDLWTRPIYYELRKLPRFHKILRAHQPDSLYRSMVNQQL